MSLPRPRRRVRRLVLACLVLFLALCAGGFVVVELDEAQREAADAELVFAEAASVRVRFEDQLYGTLNLALGLQAYVTAHPELDDRDRLDVLLATLTSEGEHIRNIALAPDDVVEVVYPLEGNEAVLGLAYEDVPDQMEAVRQARLTRSTVLDGPIELVQGGRGLVNRTPVFLEDDTYWGVLSLVVDVDSVIAAVEEASGRVGAMPIRWAVRAWSNYGDTRAVTGDQSVFGDPDVRLTFDVPDGTWELAAVPVDTAGRDQRTLALRGLVVLLAGVVAFLGFEVVRERWRVIDLSLHDPLTGLPNRRLLADRIEGAVASARRRDEPFVVAFIDLDRFKEVNDTYGHRAGDHLLQEVAHRLESRTRSTDTVARVGGDEFVLLLTDADPSQVESLVAELEEAVVAPVPWQGHELRVGVSTGIAVYPEDGTDAQDLVQRADHGMYVAKRHGHDPSLGV